MKEGYYGKVVSKFDTYYCTTKEDFQRKKKLLQSHGTYVSEEIF